MKVLLGLIFISISSLSYAGDDKFERGKEKFNALCASCHGQGGRSSQELYPTLAGQKKAYLKKQLKDFVSGKRQDPVMNAYAKMLTADDVENVTTYLSEEECK